MVGWADPAQGVYSISVAAELAGLHPQTLRIYERDHRPPSPLSRPGAPQPQECRNFFAQAGYAI